MTPPSAALPQVTELEPRRTSIRSMPPVVSVPKSKPAPGAETSSTRTPSMRTRTCSLSEPRRRTPVKAPGPPFRLSVRPGTCSSARVISGPCRRSRSAAVRTVIGWPVWSMRRGLPVATTVMRSAGGLAVGKTVERSSVWAYAGIETAQRAAAAKYWHFMVFSSRPMDVAVHGGRVRGANWHALSRIRPVHPARPRNDHTPAGFLARPGSWPPARLPSPLRVQWHREQGAIRAQLRGQLRVQVFEDLSGFPLSPLSQAPVASQSYLAGPALWGKPPPSALRATTSPRHAWRDMGVNPMAGGCVLAGRGEMAGCRARGRALALACRLVSLPELCR